MDATLDRGIQKNIEKLTYNPSISEFRLIRFENYFNFVNNICSRVFHVTAIFTASLFKVGEWMSNFITYFTG